MVLVAPTVAASVAVSIIGSVVAIAIIRAVTVAIAIAVIATAVATAIMSPGVSVVVRNLFGRGIAFRSRVLCSKKVTQVPGRVHVVTSKKARFVDPFLRTNDKLKVT